MRLAQGVLILATVCTGACQSYYKEFVELPVSGLSTDRAWDLCLDTARTKFRLDPSKTDTGLRQFTTRWKRSAQNRFGKGIRRRAYFEVVDNPNPPPKKDESSSLIIAASKAATNGSKKADPDSHLLIRYYVELQRMTSMERTRNPREDDWSNEGQDGRAEQELMHHLRLRVAGALGLPLPGARGVRHRDPMERRR